MVALALTSLAPPCPPAPGSTWETCRVAAKLAAKTDAAATTHGHLLCRVAGSAGAAAGAPDCVIAGTDSGGDDS